MGGDVPKVLLPLCGTPLLVRLLRTVAAAGLAAPPVVVVGENQPLIEDALSAAGICAEYAVQDAPLGTGHAVRCAQDSCSGAENIVVLYGDHPLVSPATVRALRAAHAGAHPLTLATAVAPDFNGINAPLADFGRIIRDDAGRIVKIAEKKDASLAELAVREVNPAYFCFTASWLWDALAQLTNANAQGEYYLTDTVHMAMRAGFPIASVAISPFEALGINTPAHLRAVETAISAQ
jgi:bifunctional UDP-N-acetylglucosamine pyrophosphorylase/glucosamine-1-phosphate N-acetyltransferase